MEWMVPPNVPGVALTAGVLQGVTDMWAAACVCIQSVLRTVPRPSTTLHISVWCYNQRPLNVARSTVWLWCGGITRAVTGLCVQSGVGRGSGARVRAHGCATLHCSSPLRLSSPPLSTMNSTQCYSFFW